MTLPSDKPEAHRPFAPAKNLRGLPRLREYRGSAALLLLAALWVIALTIEPKTGDWIGLGLSAGWFPDLHALLAAGEAHMQGMPVHRSNPLDMYGRPHSYPSAWLALGAWGLTRADTHWLGGLLLIAFLLAAVAGPRPQSGRQFAWGALVLLSPALQLGMVRANNDLVIFLLLAPLARCLSSSHAAMRFAAVGIVAAAAGLKYYPAVAGILLLSEENRRLFWWRLVAAIVLFAAVGWSVYEDTRHFATTLPAPTGFFTFGAAEGLALLGRSKTFALGIVALLALGTIGMELRLRRGRSVRTPDPEELRFILAAALLAGCFWTAMNWGYRWVFALWLLPALVRAPRPGFVLGGGEQRVLLILLPACLWGDGLSCLWWNLFGSSWLDISLTRYTELCWIGLQPIHWIVFSLLTLACVRFAWREARRLLGRKAFASPVLA